jgi:hypothetical protein
MYKYLSFNNLNDRKNITLLHLQRTIETNKPCGYEKGKSNFQILHLREI